MRSAFWAQAAVGTALILVVYLLAAGLAGPAAGLIAAFAVATYPPLVAATGDLVSEPLGALTLALAALALLRHLATTDRRPVGAHRPGARCGDPRARRPDRAPARARVRVAAACAAQRRDAARLGPGDDDRDRLTARHRSVGHPRKPRGGPCDTGRKQRPITLFVGTYLPGDGKMSGVRRELELYVRRNMSNLADVRISNVPGEFVLRAYIRERHPEIVPGPYRGMADTDVRRALSFEARRNIKTYARHQPLAFAAMELGKVKRMWGGYYRGGTRNPRTWINAWHLALLGLTLAGAIAGLTLARRRRAELTLLLIPVLLSTLVQAVFVAQARHNLRVLPLLIAAGAAGAVLAWRVLPRRGGAAAGGRPARLSDPRHAARAGTRHPRAQPPPGGRTGRRERTRRQERAGRLKGVCRGERRALPGYISRGCSPRAARATWRSSSATPRTARSADPRHLRPRPPRPGNRGRTQ